MDLKSYLNRIGIAGISDAEKGSASLLAKLQERHLLSVPFEDLDIPDKRIELDINKIYDKIIPSRRGGFCYELNGLFNWLLISLGYKSVMLSARVFNSSTGEYGPEFDHMTLLVKSDKDYLADVGFGDSFRIPIEMPSDKEISVIEDVSGRYRLIHIGKNIFDLQREENKKWIPQYRFSSAPRRFSDYKEMCDYQQDSPSSHFRTRRLCTIATETGRITLNDNSLTITDGNKKNKMQFEGKNEFSKLLKEYFGIVM